MGLRHTLPVILCALLTPAPASAQNTTPIIEKIPRNLTPLQLEPFGKQPARAWVSPISLRQVKKTGHWYQLFEVRITENGRQSQLVSLNLNTGKIHAGMTVPGIHFGKGVWVNDQFYIGTNRGGTTGHLYRFDPASLTMTDLGPAFKERGFPWKLAVGPDQTIAIAAAFTSEISQYDPAAGELVHHGVVGKPSHGYVYYISQDEGYIYAALRGTVPWELVAFNKTTKQNRVIATVGAKGVMKLSGSYVKMTDDPGRKTGWQKYHLANGQVDQTLPAPRESSAQHEPKPATPPKVMLDDSPTYAGQEKVFVHYQSPEKIDQWHKAIINAPLQPADVVYATTLPDGRIAAAGHTYQPLVVFDPASPEQSTRLAPMSKVSSRNLLVVNGIVYTSGYPSTILMRFDPNKPVTPQHATPAQAAIPMGSPEANPRLVHYFSKDLDGAHIGVQTILGHDGRIWICGRRHRYYKGFGLAWFDPKTEKRGVINTDGALDHFQIGWMCSMNGGKQLAAATYIQPNPHMEGSAADNAKLFLFDLKEDRLISQHVPVPGATKLIGVAQTSENELIGLALTPDTTKPPHYEAHNTTIYRFDLKTHKVTAQRTFGRTIQGIPSTTGLPGKGSSFKLGPDGKIWTTVNVAAGQSMLIRINPSDLSIEALGSFPSGGCRILFSGDEIFLTGMGPLQKLKL